ncbi:MAG: DUF3473 domain-containing protein [Rhodospirillales bacterium]|nr:DUF3473 domain-containing protein [Rhodospirillales bacterium]
MAVQGDDSARRHVLSVVLEDYCHVGPVSRVVPPDYWHRFESRVQRNTHRTLDLLDEMGAKATFFVLGWIGEHQPEIVAEVARRGHEIASKGYFHRSIDEMSPQAFREEVRRSRISLEDATGMPIRGYRASRGGLRKTDLWALDILAEEGFLYDSSVRPFGIGFAKEDGFSRVIHRREHAGRDIWEVPLSSWQFGPLTVPISGGNYLRQLPQGLIRHAIDQWVRVETSPLVFYFHVWELDPEQPRISAVTRLERIRQYRNLHAMEQRIRHYLGQYRFGTIADHLQLPEVAFDPARIAQRTPAQPVKPISVTSGPARARTPISVVIPCFNEEATLGYLSNTLDSFIETVRDEYQVSFVFVDDGSGDKTWERLNELFAPRADCQVVQHPHNRGIAAATLTGIRHARTEIVCAIDADGTFDPHQLKEMIPMLKPDVDAVTASCFHEHGQIMNVPGWRMGLSKGASALYRAVLHNKLSHYTSCFRVYRKSTLANITLRNERYVGITEILSWLDMQGSKIVEYPAVLEVRLLGQSKMKILKTIGGHLQLIAALAGERISEALSSKPETPGERQHL